MSFTHAYVAAILFGVLMNQACPGYSAPMRNMRAVNMCENESNYLSNQEGSAVLSCISPSNIHNVQSIDWKHDGNTLDIQGPKYATVANRLQINNIQPTDEGVYSCVVTDETSTQTEVEVLCLYVLGKSTFATCPEEQSCLEVEQITVAAGETVSFDTRVMYIHSGPSLRHQSTQNLQLIKGQENIYYCLDWGQYKDVPCSSSGRVRVVQGTHKFDVQLLLENTTFNDSGLYTANVEAVNPLTGSTSAFMKAFQVTVEAPQVHLTIGSTGASIAGTEYSLTCIPDAPGSTAQLQWMDSTGMVLVSSSDLTVVLQDDGSLQLTFNPLTGKHRGDYTCKATLTWATTEIVVTESSTAQVKVVEVTSVTATPISGSEVKVTWDSNDQHSNIAHYTVYLTALSAGKLVSAVSIQVPGDESSAVIQLDELTVNITYHFQVSATVPDSDVQGEKTPVTAQSTVNFDEETFQVKVGPMEQCTLWNLDFDKAEFVAVAIRKAVARQLSSVCNCSFPQGNIRGGRLICGDDDATVVTYRSVVVAHEEMTALELRRSIEEWTDEIPKPVVSVGSFLFNIVP